MILKALVHGVMTCVTLRVYFAKDLPNEQIEGWARDGLRRQVSKKSTVIATGIETWNLWEKQMNAGPECTMGGVHYDLYSYCDGWIEDDSPST